MTDDPNANTKATICNRLIDGESLRTICRSDGMPSKSTVCLWLAADEDFQARYSAARRLQAETLQDEILDISNTPLLGLKTTTKDGKVETVEGDMIEHRRLQVDARKWVASKLDPKRYGEASLLKLADAEGQKLDMPESDMSVRLASLAASLIAKHKEQ